jgi:hypothetical protein
LPRRITFSPEGGHAVRGEAELCDARGDRPQRDRVGQERTDHQHDLHEASTGGISTSRSASTSGEP